MCLLPSDSDVPATDEELIKTLVQRWAAAVRREDVEGAVLSHSQDILLFDVPPPLQSRGIDAYRASWDTYFQWAEGGAFDVSELEVTAGDTVAFCHGIIRCAGRSADGRRTELRIRLTVGCRKIDGQWLVTHEHHSEPSAG